MTKESSKLHPHSKPSSLLDDPHASTQAYIDFMRFRCLELFRTLKPTGSFYYHSDWHWQ